MAAPRTHARSVSLAALALILIIAEPQDIHARVVARRLEQRGAAHRIVNSADFPLRLKMSAHYSDDRFGVRLADGPELVRSDEIDGVWLRRFRAHEISASITDEAVAAYAYHEARDLFLGWLASVPNVMNPRTHEWRAELKPFQLVAAQEAGLRVPRTIVSNDPREIRDFVKTVRDVIFKAMAPTEFQFTPTTTFEERHLELIDSIAFAPTMFQQRIHAERHLRITVVDDCLFAASIEPVREAGMLDWRLDRDPRMQPFDLPVPIRAKLRALRRRLGLRYGAIDMIVDKAGEYVFLEINPGGQFLFAEIHARLPISDAIADALMAYPAAA